MKCPNCGAETTAKFCEYCGSEIVKNEPTTSKCPNCGSNKVSFKRERIGTATESTSYKNAFSSGRTRQSVSQTAYQTVGVCQSCGYTWNPNARTTEKKKKSTWLWVLGWICIFPIPLTILMLRKKDMKPAVKYGIIAAAWILYFIIGMSGGDSTETVPSQAETKIETTTSQQQEVATKPVETMATEPASVADNAVIYMENIVSAYNAQAEEQLVFVEDFVPQDKESGHYRTEFRLGAYDNAVGKSYLLGDKVVDLVYSETIFGDVNFRVYTNDTSLDQVVALVQGMSPLMDTDMSAQELNDTLNKVKTDKYVNGYYFGDLGLLLLGSEAEGFELMIKLE